MADNTGEAAKASSALTLACHVEQSDLGWESAVRISLPPLPDEAGTVTLEITEGPFGRALGKFEFRLLEEADIRALMLANLTASDAWLWIRTGAYCYPGSLVPCSSDSLLAEIRFAGSPLAAFLPRATEAVKLTLLSGNEERLVHQARFRFTKKPATYRSAPLPLQNHQILAISGDHVLRFSVAEREIARLQFRTLNERELVRHVRVSEIQTEAETRGGEILPGMKTLRWEEHRAFRPTLRIETEVIAPRSLIRCIVRLLQGTTVLRCEEFMLPLDQGIRHIRLQRLELGNPGLSAQPKPMRLVISASIGGEIKGASQLVVLPPERITNFEGQLTFDAAELPFDQAEYDLIAQRLGLTEERTGNRGIWAKIRRLGRRRDACCVPNAVPQEDEVPSPLDPL